MTFNHKKMEKFLNKLIKLMQSLPRNSPELLKVRNTYSRIISAPSQKPQKRYSKHRKRIAKIRKHGTVRPPANIKKLVDNFSLKTNYHFDYRGHELFYPAVYHTHKSLSGVYKLEFIS